MPARTAPRSRPTPYSNKQAQLLERHAAAAHAAVVAGDYEGAVAHYEKYLAIDEGSPEVHNNLANASRALWRMDVAVRHYRRALALREDFATAHYNLGVTLFDVGRAEEALPSLRRALALRPDDRPTLLALMSACKRAGRAAEVLPHLARFAADAERDDTAARHVEHGLACCHGDRDDDARQAFERALRRDPACLDALRYLALLHERNGRYAEALERLDRALRLAPDLAELHFYRAVQLLRLGRLAEGFAEYEWRWRHTQFTSPRTRHGAIPEWDGGDLAGKTILLETEQGLGDTLQFVRFAQALAARGATVVLECEESLARLLGECAGVSRVVVKGEAIPAVDVRLPLMSLPHRLGTTLETLPAEVPYLRAPGAEVVARGAADRPRVGLCWAGSPGHVRDHERSIALDRLTPLLERDDVALVSLQKGPAAERLAECPAAAGVTDAGARLADLRDTANLVASLDLVVTVDTSLAHLAGALGRPTWVLVAYDADWRWLTDRSDSPWYPTVRLFRQPKRGDWDSVIAELASALSEFVSEKTVATDRTDDTDGARFRKKAVSVKSVQSVAAREQVVAAEGYFKRAVQAHLANDLATAAEHYARVIAIAPRHAEAHNNLGVIQRANGDTDRALASFRAALGVRGDYVEALNNLGSMLAERGEFAEAAGHLRTATALRPQNGEAWRTLGLALRESGDAAGALAALERALALRPDDARTHDALGGTLLALGRQEDAVRAYERAVALAPDFADAHSNFGVALRAQGEGARALACFQRALALRPDYLEAMNNLGLALREAGDTDESLRVLRDAHRRWPQSAHVLSNLAGTLHALGLVDEACDMARAALAADATLGDPWNVLGNCAGERGDHAEALRCYDAAIAADGRDPFARWNRALTLLLLGRFEEGWAEHERRWAHPALAVDRRAFAPPAWTGESLDAKTILLWTEQGAGDAMQFVRFAAEIKRRWNARVVVECMHVVAPVFRCAPAVDEVVPRGAALPAFDVHAPLMSLPALLGVAPERFADGLPAFRVPPRDVERLVPREAGVLNVGVVWAGRPEHKRDRYRSTTLEAIATLGDVPGVRLFSLQKGAAADGLALLPAGRLADVGARCTDFVDTAAAIARLDVVVTVDTSVAHLAASLGARTWILVPKNPDWRWMLEREDTPWYPSARLFRQDEGGRWEPVLARVAGELARLRESLAPAPSNEPPPVTPSTLAAPGAFAEVHGGQSAAPALTAPVAPALPTTTLASAQRLPDGTPRFTLSLPLTALADPAGFARYEQELVGDGADAEVRGFFDAELRDGDLVIDVGAGWGLASLGAATAPGRAAHVVAVVPSAEEADGLYANAEANADALTGALHVAVCAPVSDAPVDDIVAACADASGRVLLRVADAGDLPGVLARSAALVESGRLAAVVWAEQGNALADAIMRDGLGALGFSHFRIIGDTEGPLLVPYDAAEGTAVISLSEACLAAQEDEAAEGEDAGQGETVEIELAGRPFAIDWNVTTSSGWGVYGLNVALRCAEPDGPRFVPLRPMTVDGLAPAARARLARAAQDGVDVQAAMAQAQAQESVVTAPFPILRALGNGLSGVPLPIVSDREVGVVFLEDSVITDAEAARAARYARLIAGSTWNGRLLAARGFADVRVVLQGVDTTVFHPGPRAGRFGDRFVVFSGGKLEYRKGQDLVVAAFREFHRRHPDALLAVAWHNHWPQTMAELPTRGHVRGVPAVDADGRLRLAEWLEANGLPAGSFVDLGLVANHDMGRLLREVDAAVFPNRAEGGTNLVAMECLATGVPTALSANTGHLDLAFDEICWPLRDQGACVTTPTYRGVDGWGETSVAELVETLEAMYADRDGARARGRCAAEAMEQLAWPNQVERLMAEIGDLF